MADAYQGIIPGPELEKLISRRGPDWWDSAIRKGSRIAILAFGDKVAGYANYGRNRARSLYYDGEIYELYLRPEFQGLGLRPPLFTAARRDLAQSGLKSLVVWALSDNEPAVGVLRALGGRAVARSSERFGDQGLDKVRLRLAELTALACTSFCRHSCFSALKPPAPAIRDRAGRAHRVHQQARDRHRPDAARHRRDRARDLRGFREGHVADDAALAVVAAARD